MRRMYYVDMHCHPSIKPYSFTLHDFGNNWDCRNVQKSIWFDDPPKQSDKKINRHIGLTKFTQSDFRTLVKGDVKIISAALSPIERGLFVPRGPIKWIALKLLRFGLELSDEYIRHVKESDRDYFDDLKKEYEYYIAESGKPHNSTSPTQFELICDLNEIEPHLIEFTSDKVYVFFSIEGCHVFNNGGLRSDPWPIERIKQNIKEVKEWNFPPLYASLAHHMKNNLCGHEKSLIPILFCLINQKKGMGEGIKENGRVVVNELLRTDNGKRIYIDIKHMSVQSREDYYDILDNDYPPPDCIPVLASHGAVNGLKSPEEPDEEHFHNDVGNIYQSENELKFNKEPINYFNSEIIRIERSKGFLGIQLDERRLCTTEQRRRNRIRRKRGELLYSQAGLVWKQIRYIAEVLDNKGKFGWGTATIGSDFDGAVDPPNGYWTSADFTILEENLVHHAAEYFRDHIQRLKPINQLQGFNTDNEKAREVIDRFMRRNAVRFLRDFLHIC